MHIITHRVASKCFPEGLKSIIKHPILQDNYDFILILKQQRCNTQSQSVVMISATPLNSSTNVDEQQMLHICSLFMHIMTLCKRPHLLLPVFIYLI